MENIELVNHDAHVKTHQRHILISWLDSAKNERIRKLIEEKTDLPKKKLKLPDVVVPDKKLCYDLEINKDIFAVTTKNDIKVSHNAIDVPVLFDKNNFKNINIANIKINDSKLDFKVDINTEEFSNINKGSVKLPDRIGKFNFDIKKNNLNILSHDYILPQNKKLDFKVEIPEENFADIKFEKIELGENPDLKIDIEKTKFESIKIKDVKLPAKMPVVQLDVDVDVALNKNVVLPAVPALKIELVAFDNINKDNITIPSKISEFTLEIDTSANDMLNKKIALPQKVTEVKIDIPSEAFENIAVCDIKVEPEAYDFKLDIKEFNADRFKKVELPQVISDYKNTISQPQVNIDLEKINTIPKSITIPELHLQNANTEITKGSNITVPDNSDILQILKSEQSQSIMQ